MSLPVFSRPGLKWLGLEPRLANLSGFMLAADGMTDNDLALMAVAVYAMHRATAYYRRTPPSDSEQIRDFLQAMCQSAVRGHRVSTKMLDFATRLRHAAANARSGRRRSRSPRRTGACEAENQTRRTPDAPRTGSGPIACDVGAWAWPSF